MAGTSPLIDYPGGGSLAEWAETLDDVMTTLDFETVIPGHGPVTNKAGLLTYRNNVDKMKTARYRLDSRRQEPGRSRQGHDRRIQVGAPTA